MPEITGGEIIDPGPRPFLTYHFATGTAGTPLTLIPRYTLPPRCLGRNITSHLTPFQDYPDSGAQLCVAGDITPVTLSGEPQCRTQSQSTGGTIVGTDGTVLLSASQGTTQSTIVTVTQESSLAVGTEVSAKARNVFLPAQFADC